MRPLPDLAPLDQQPSVFSQPTDDWNGIFANEFAGTDSQQAASDQQIAQIYPAMDPISQTIDAIGGILDEGTSVLSLLSGDLDLVDLTPEIVNFQQADSLLDSNLSNPVFDFTAAAESLLGQMVTLILKGLQYLWDIVRSAIGFVLGAIEYLFEAIGILETFGPLPTLPTFLTGV